MQKKIFSVLITSLLFLNIGVFSQNSDITIAELRQHVYFLAADSLQGRKPGSAGSKLAAAYIHQHLFNGKTAQLEGDAGYQYFKVVTALQPGENTSFKVGKKSFKAMEDFTPLSFSENASANAPLAFVGYGMDFDADSVHWHDYAGIDVTGRWVLVLLGDPDMDNPSSPFAQHSQIRHKVMIARDHGAAGILFVAGENVNKNDDLLDLTFDMSESTAGLPALQIKRSIGDLLLKESGTTVNDQEKRVNDSKTSHSFMINKTVTATVEIDRQYDNAVNIMALIEGSDPRLKKQVIVVGAHYDHLGYGGYDSGSRKPDTLAVHNGADDNASGVAAMLEIAQKIAALPQGLKRSVLFIAFDGEEMGRLGSSWFVRNPPVPLQNIEIMLNMDMIGRLDSVKNVLTVMGTGTAAGLVSIMKPSVEKSGLTVNASPEGYGPSDHASFYVQDIPVLMFFTGAHEDYHTPADDTDRINYSGLQKITELVYDLVCELGNRELRLIFTEAGPKNQPELRRQFQVTLGIVPDHASTDVQGLRVDGVIKERPAAFAGMKKGDIIIALDGKPVNNIYDYMHRLSDFKTGQIISVEIIRDGDKHLLIVEL
ncbi:MAG TPA: M20/M25/M40 family metallo-hydrolase [bacterium]|nr:M20/M25/M40 family metallo-hydrolase [bacterium]HPN42867.1 M20/M25/M40 family metallo-hydrolase [bacterium]